MARNSTIFKRIIQLVLDAATVARTKKGLQDALQQGTDAKHVKNNLKKIDAAMLALGRTAVGIGAAILSVFSARKLIEYADTWKLIQGRLKIVTEGHEALRRVQGKLFDVAQRTRSSFEATAQLFTRIALNADELGRTEQQLLDLTETVNKAIQIGGGNTTEARAGVIQLSQALASGVLRGDEFRSMMENLPGLAKALADGLDVPVGKLREMAFAGELTADTVIDAILKMKGAVDEEFKNIPVTVGGALQVLTNEIMALVGAEDEATGTTNLFAQALLDVAAAIDKITEARKRGRDASAGMPRSLDNAWADLGMGPLTPEEAARIRKIFGGAPGGDFGTDIDAANLAAAQERANQRTPSAIFGAFLAKITSDRTDMLVRAKAGKVATPQELAELNQLFAEGNRFLREGNLTLQQRVDLIKAIMDLGFKEAELETEEELRKKQREHIDLLLDAHELGVANLEERQKLVVLHDGIVRALKNENLAIEDRIHLTQLLIDMEKRAPWLSPDFFRRATPDKQIHDPLFNRRDKEGDLIIRAPKVAVVESQELLEIYTNQWREAHADIEDSAINAAFGVMGAWQDAFEALAIEGQGFVGFMEAIFRGSAAAALGGLAQVASIKVAENVANAFEQKAKASAAIAGAISNPFMATQLLAAAAAHLDAAKDFGLTAAKWALLGGAAAAGQAGIAGGGRGGQSGGIPSGATDSTGRLADRVGAGGGLTINLTISGVDPKNPRHQELIGKTVREYGQRTGRSLIVNQRSA